MPTEAKGELTENQAFEAILEWSADRAAWQRDALRRLITNGTLTDNDLNELTAICCDPNAPSVPLAKTHLKQTPASSEPISLRRVAQPKGINALPDDQELEFGIAGLTVVYGDNGSGKSGYVRVLKHACRTRDGQTSIRRDVEDSKGTPQSAIIAFARGDVEDTFNWTPQATAHPELPSVSIFDTRSANIHVEKTNAVAYIPAPMQVLESLAVACDAIKNRIDAQAGILRGQTPLALSASTLSRDTAAGSFIHTLSGKSNVSQLDLLATLKADEVKRLAELQSDLSQNPKQSAARLQSHKQKLQSLKAQMAKLCDATDDAAFIKRNELRAELDQKTEAARVASESLFAASPLPDVGKDTWRQLWEAARRYADDVAYPKKKFPQATAGDDFCVLCQQPLTKEAITRQETFETFVKGTTKADELGAEKIFNDLVGAAAKVALAGRVRRDAISFCSADLGEDALAVKIHRALTIAAWRLRALLKGAAAPCPAADFPDQDCSGLEARLSERIARLSADDASPVRQAQMNELQEFNDRQTLNALVADVKVQIGRLKAIEKLEAAAKSTAKRSVTEANKKLSDKLVTDALRGRFAREVEKLKLTSMPVELRKVRDSNATSYFQVSLIEKPSEPIGEILSEGEHRCIALAAFMAELVTSHQKSGIVFDDPMSSLDHMHRRVIAARLVEEAEHRQVVIFTHDLAFLYELRREAESKGKTIHFQTVFRRSEKPGFIEGVLPLKARNALQRANGIRSELKACKQEFEKGTEIHRTVLAKGMIEQLREAWDQAIADIIHPVLDRFDNKIAGGSLFKLAVLTESDVIITTEARSRLSEDLHVSASALNPASVTHQQLVEEVAKLETWAHDIYERQKKAVEPKRALVSSSL